MQQAIEVWEALQRHQHRYRKITFAPGELPGKQVSLLASYPVRCPGLILLLHRTGCAATKPPLDRHVSSFRPIR